MNQAIMEGLGLPRSQAKAFFYSNDYPFTAAHSQATQFLDLNTCSHHPTRMFWRKTLLHCKKSLQTFRCPFKEYLSDVE